MGCDLTCHLHYSSYRPWRMVSLTGSLNRPVSPQVVVNVQTASLDGRLCRQGTGVSTLPFPSSYPSAPLRLSTTQNHALVLTEHDSGAGMAV